MCIKALLLTAIALTFSASANATTVFIDNFTIVKNDIVLFNDTFDNGIPPPDTGGNTQQYGVIGGPLGTESGGKLALDASLGEVVEHADTGAMQRQGARVITNIDPAQPTKGLRTDDTFSVTGIFDITNLMNVREKYGVRLTDGASSNQFPNDGIGISIMRTSISDLNVVFHSYDQTAFIFTDLELILLDDSNEQIALTLSRLNPADSIVTASFAYINGGIMGATTTFTATDTLFNGEDFTIAQFIYLTPVPVPAAAWLFGSGLLGLIGIARRKKA